jgi:RecA-family ATPase
VSALATCLAHKLEQATEQKRWLIEELWADEAVGIVGGEPKCCKSILALELAVAVASGTPCLRRFPTRREGPVLMFAAEDALHVVRERLEGICAAGGVPFDTLPVHVITAPSLRIDLGNDRKRLRETVQAIRPELLVLDPFVRLHRADENVASDVAPLLAFLRELQRELRTAVLLVHHSRKGGHARAGQALRGSSELHAWGDSNLYLRRNRDRIQLSVEH